MLGLDAYTALTTVFLRFVVFNFCHVVLEAFNKSISLCIYLTSFLIKLRFLFFPYCSTYKSLLLLLLFLLLPLFLLSFLLLKPILWLLLLLVLLFSDLLIFLVPLLFFVSCFTIIYCFHGTFDYYCFQYHL